MPATEPLLSSNTATVRSALDDGVDPNRLVGGDADDRRALAVQCFMGRFEIARLLIDRGANPDFGRCRAKKISRIN